MTTRYDIWKTASPPEGEECCDDCSGQGTSDCCGAGYDSDIGICMDCKEHCDEQECADEHCHCHAEDGDDGDAAYDSMRDDELTKN